MEALLEARDRRAAIQLPSNLGLECAYRLGAQLDRRLRSRGFHAVGYKVGFTNPDVWAKWGLDEPILFPVYDRTVAHTTTRKGVDTRATAPLSPYRAPRLEVEVVFGVYQGAQPVPGPRTGSGLPAHLAWVALGVEIVDCHERSWRLSPAGSVADFGLHGKLVIGPRILAADPGFTEVVEYLDFLQVSLWRKGDAEPTATGKGNQVLGHPLSVLEAVPRLAPYFDPLDIPGPEGIVMISTGTMTPLASCRAGETWQVCVGSADSHSREPTSALTGFEVALLE